MENHNKETGHLPHSQESLTPKSSTRKSLNRFHLEVSRAEDHLKISAYEQEAGEAETVRHYEEIPVPIDTISARCREMAETLNKTNRQGRVSPDILVKLREIGQVFFDDLLTHSVKEKIRNTKTENLILSIDDTLVHVPWELLFDGNQFLCQRFNMGRLVKTRQNVFGAGRSRDLSGPLKMMIWADPGGDLNGAYSEGVQLRDYIDQNSDFINVSLRADNISSDYVKEKIRNYDFVHYAGHSDYDRENPGESGWRLSSGRFRAQEITKMAGTGAMPSLIFSNACQSARTEGWEIKASFHDEIFGLANAFVLAGVKHYVGTFWEILDEPSRRFALEFYKHMFSGMSVGEAMRHARLVVIKEYGEETIVWASYLLYGDPAFNYIEHIQKTEALNRKKQESLHTGNQRPVPRSHQKIRASDDFSERKPRKRKPDWKRLSVAVLLFVSVVLWGYPGILRNSSSEYEAAAVSYYNAGNFEDALDACKTIENKNPQVRLGYLVQGDIYLRQGNLDPARSFYQKALEASKGTDREKADALIGLGRIASVQNRTDQALEYYRQATDTAPESSTGYLAQAMLANNSGDLKESLELLGKAGRLSPDNRLLASVTGEIRSHIRVLQDQEKQERISRLVADLLESMKSPSQALGSDNWTSVPLTLWLMDFEIQGYAMQEGEDRLIGAGIADALTRDNRVRLVERALLDKLLEELKLGTSRLTERSTALSLGKIMAARFILSGRIIHSGPHAQVSVRLIETETGLITAALTEPFAGAVPTSDLTEKLSENLLNKLKERYPLRGKISKVKGNEIRLNIGQKEGVAIGQRFKVKNGDVIIEVISGDTDTSLVKIIQGEKVLTESLQVEAF
ncbi:MAG: CHAT domain-containing protein [Desulfobacterales bacterium]|nr:CHAT domain-containing protein [Desulfobacterales bacterium]